MSELESPDKSELHDWVFDETEHINMIASWENLYAAYDALRFTDKLSDAERIDEFKWITQQMNIFLTSMRKKLMTAKDVQAVQAVLEKSFTSEKVNMDQRRQLAFQKLKQQWIRSMLTRASMMEEGEEADARD